jgi:hypothetical protein
MVVEVSVVVCVLVMELTVVLVIEVSLLDVTVSVVQYWHVRSHMPANSPQVEQNSVSQGSLQGLSKLWQVRLQNHSGFRLIISQEVSEVPVTDWEVVVPVVVDAEVDETEVVLTVVVVTEVELSVVVPEVSVVVSVLVVPFAQISHVVSHMCAAEHVGQNTSSHEHRVAPFMQGTLPLVISAQDGTQSSYLKQVVAVEVEVRLWVVAVVLTAVVVVRDVDDMVVEALVLTDMEVSVLVPVVTETVVVFVLLVLVLMETVVSVVVEVAVDVFVYVLQ